MRATVQFGVTGATLADLYSQAGKEYQRLIGDPETALPHDTTLEVYKIEVPRKLSGDEIVETLGWAADVTIISQGKPDK